jgi:hypothetical protein
VSWSTPKPVQDLELAFGGNMKELLPAISEIPQEFYRDKTSWNHFVDKWFFNGLPSETVFQCKNGVDGNMAIRHLRAIMCSFEPKHEHKTGGVAWLASLWFDDVLHDGKSLIGKKHTHD